MPDILTHILFSRKVAGSIPDVSIREEIDGNLPLFFLAAQGPDFLFYHTPLRPFHKKIIRIGQAMHRKDTAMFFIDAMERMKAGGMDDGERTLFLVYFLGFLTHFFMDKEMHPYVFDVTSKGIWDMGGNRHPISHYDLEFQMDIILWERETGTHAVDMDLSEWLRVDRLPEEVCAHFIAHVQRSFGIVLDRGVLDRSVRSMLAVLGILYDPGYRKKFLRWLPTPRRFYTHPGNQGYDILNEGKNAWNHPGEPPKHQSVPELLEQAGEECARTIGDILSYLGGTGNKRPEEIIPDVSYDTNRPWRQGGHMPVKGAAD
ncbi:MAG: zinc dependent phospholipase C family protein [Clostridia bacterium]